MRPFRPSRSWAAPIARRRTSRSGIPRSASSRLGALRSAFGAACLRRQAVRARVDAHSARARDADPASRGALRRVGWARFVACREGQIERDLARERCARAPRVHDVARCGELDHPPFGLGAREAGCRAQRLFGWHPLPEPRHAWLVPFFGTHAFALSVVGAPGRIRTCDFRLRRPALCPAELQALRWGGWSPSAADLEHGGLGLPHAGIGSSGFFPREVLKEEAPWPHAAGRARWVHLRGFPGFNPCVLLTRLSFRALSCLFSLREHPISVTRWRWHGPLSCRRLVLSCRSVGNVPFALPFLSPDSSASLPAFLFRPAPPALLDGLPHLCPSPVGLVSVSRCPISRGIASS